MRDASAGSRDAPSPCEVECKPFEWRRGVRLFPTMLLFGLLRDAAMLIFSFRTGQYKGGGYIDGRYRFRAERGDGDGE